MCWVSQKSTQMKLGISMWLVLSVLLGLALCETNGTEAYFLSPHGLGKTPEVDDALQKITSQIRVKTTTYNHSTITYILSNITIGTAYNDGKQNTTVPKVDIVQVTGGRIEFTYRFNYTKIENRNNITGYAYGSVLSDPLTYFKELNFCEGFLCWRLPNTKGVEPLTLIQNRMRIKRMDPFNQSDLENMEDMLDKVFQQIEPANFEVQILQIFNQIFPLALNESLNHETYGRTINYTYHSNTHGQMKMNIIHKVYGFGVDPVDGYHVVYVTEIENWAEPICNTTVPVKPFAFELYGGSQNVHLTCLYESVVSYVHSNKWLDTVLNEGWQSNAFQFYAGDLFDLINNLYLSFSPRAVLNGSCEAQKEGLRIYASREFKANEYTLDVTYKCSMRATNNQGSETTILKFTSNNKFYINAEATTKTLSFKIILAEVLNLSFEPVGSFFVSNIPLALYKVNQAMKKLANTFVFGTDFPTVPRDLPKTTVSRDYILYYDASHLGENLQ